MKYSKYNLITKSDSGKVILFNTLTGHCFLLNENTYLSLIENNPGKLNDKKITDLFIKHSIIIQDHIDEQRYFHYYQNKIKFSSSDTSATVLLTWGCNLSCVYCYEGASSKSGNMTKDGADKFISFMINRSKMNRSNQMSVNLFGGEPIINIDTGIYILKSLYDYCNNNNISFSSSIITNGTLLNDEVVDNIIKYNCRQAQITLDGIESIHNSRRPYKNGRGSFDKIINNLYLLNRRHSDIHTVIRINVDKINLKDTYILLEYIGNKNINLTNCNVDFGIIRGSTNACSSYSGNCLTEAEIGNILDSLWSKAKDEGFLINTRPYRKWMFCGLYSDSQFTITPECDVYKCWEHTGEKEHKVGEINKSGQLDSITYAYFDWMTHNPLDNSDCSSCIYLPSCGGGCGVISYNNTKTYHSKGCIRETNRKIC